MDIRLGDNEEICQIELWVFDRVVGSTIDLKWKDVGTDVDS